MSVEATLLAMCEAAPADDEPRMLWADHVGGERGELVHVQCALTRGGLTPAQSGALRVRQGELLAEHGAAWSGLAAWAQDCRFRRGFVELATFMAPKFLAHADAIFAAAPLLASIAFEQIDEPQLAALIAHPIYPRVRGLAFKAMPIRAAIDGNAFAQLETLEIYGLHGRALPLVDSGQLAKLTRFELGPGGGLVGLLAATPNLRAMGLGGSDMFQSIQTLPPTITELAMNPGPLNGTLDKLAQLPLAQNLEKLTLYYVQRTGVMPALAEFSKLRSLEIHMVGNLELDILFAQSSPPMLRELRCNRLARSAIDRVAEKLGPQLELLELTGYEPGPHLEHARARVAGELRVGTLGSRPPPFAGQLPAAPLWDYPLVRL